MNIVLINDLIDQHGDTFTRCKGCSICKKISKLRGRERSPEEKYKHILDKGQDMTLSDISFLVDRKVQKRKIQHALKMNAEEFFIMMSELGLSKRRVQKVGKVKLSQEAYEQLKAKGLSEKEIAKKLNVSTATIWNHKKQWKNNTVTEPTPKTFTPTINQTPASEYNKLIFELRERLSQAEESTVEKETIIQKLEAKVKELEGINSACDDVESELESLREERDNYRTQLLDTRDKLVRLDYTVENQKKIIEDTGKALERYEHENKALRKLVSLWA